jgi:hypothetical protein
MNFANSAMQARYDKYWNDNVVTVDKKIRDYLSFNSFFSINYDVVKPLVLQYIAHINNLADNLTRQSYNFHD